MNAKLGVGFLCLLMLLLLAIVTPVAAEGKPIGACPPGFTLTPLSELSPAVAEWPATDGNGDGMTCVKPLDIPPFPLAINIVDNRVMKP